MFISKFDISMLKSIKSWKVQAPSQGKPLMEPFCKRIPATMQQHSANFLFICSCRDYFKKWQIIDVKIFTIFSFYQGSFWIKKCYTLILEITNVFSLKILEHITIFLCFHFQVSSNFNLITYIKMDWITGQRYLCDNGLELQVSPSPSPVLKRVQNWGWTRTDHR